jgi:type IV pilus assembly protein PilB
MESRQTDHFEMSAKLRRSFKRLGERLLSGGVIDEEQLRLALERQKQTGAFIGESLVSLGFVQPAQLGPYLEQVTGYPFVDLSEAKFEDDVCRALPEGIARRKMALPFLERNGEILVAMSDPLNVATLDEVRSLLGGRAVSPHLALAVDLEEAFKRAYDPRQQTASIVKDITDDAQAAVPLDVLVGQAEDAPIVRLVKGIIAGATTMGASDIHIEPGEYSVRVRYRVDGLLYDQMTVPRHHLQATVSRLKIMSNLDIAERRRPQDGRFPTKDEAGREYEVRLSIMPTIYGEKAVMRVLEKTSSLGSLDRLGFYGDQLATFERFIKKPHGIILVTGPTGSGKSTTLYAGLQRINSPTLNINSIEDPVEYRLQGVNQVQVNAKIGVTFATGLRTLVRQDPDVILVGEIRDSETAEIAVQAALTGHLVLSTLHTNDAPGALVRLQNMGVEPFLLSSAVLGIVGQRLLRTICTGCKETSEATPEIIAALGLPVGVLPPLVARGRGCPRCNGRGMKGRTAVYEIMPVTEAIREKVLRSASGSELKQQAMAEGMMTMREAGVKKVLDLSVAPEEALRVLSLEEL